MERSNAEKPNLHYGEGTYIRADGSYERLNNYTIEPPEMLQEGEYRFSSKWRVTFPGVKDEAYTIEPVCDDQLNRVYYELLAEIKDSSGKCVDLLLLRTTPWRKERIQHHQGVETRIQLHDLIL